MKNDNFKKIQLKSRKRSRKYTMTNKILELYSGIGGMHCAWRESGLDGEIIAAVDINTVANVVYQHNFPNTTLLNRNIQNLTIADIEKMCINTILMSPPCQPFTRNGKYLDARDPRTDSFIYLINLLEKIDKIEYILMENVKGFECSSVQKLFIDKLKECNFEYQEFLLCPSNMGVPNSRLRYYCIARRNSLNWPFKMKAIMSSLRTKYELPDTLEKIIEKDVPDSFLLTKKHLKHGNVLDICHSQSKRSCCFTKAYSHYVEGTGSVYTEKTPEKIQKCYEIANNFSIGSDDFIATLCELKLRFFTPKEVLSLMRFPIYYKFPEIITTKQCYRLLGNSINVKVVSELLKILFTD